MPQITLQLDLTQFHMLAAFTLGLLLNLVLILVNRRYKRNTFRDLSRAILLGAALDAAYCCVGLVCQRVVVIKSGCFLDIGYGLERRVPKVVAYFISSADEFFVAHSVTILPVLYYYRYVVTSRTQTPSWTLLLRSAVFSFAISGFFVLLSVLSHLKADERGHQHYESLLSDEWRDSKNQSLFVGAHDTRDPITVVYYGYALLWTPACNAVAVWYGWKTIRLMRMFSQQAGSISALKVTLMKQFTVNLVVQTVITYNFTILPSTVLMGCLWLGGDATTIGPLCVFAMSWTPAVNALVTLIVIKPYRVIVMRPFAFNASVLNSSTRKIFLDTTANPSMGHRVGGSISGSHPI